MFLYPTGAQGMEAYGEKEAQQQVYDGFRAEGYPDGGDKSYFRGPVQGHPFIKGLYLAQPGDTEDLEYGIEQQPDHFTDEEIIDEPGFPTVREVGVEFVNALEGMMLYVVAFEGNGAGEKLGEVGEDAGEPVGAAAFEEQVVCALVDHHEERVVGKGAEEVGSAHDQPPGLVFQQPTHGDLEQDQPQDGEYGVSVLSDQFSHFRMLLQDLFCTESVRFLLDGINKIGSL
jgi:hypothetical protein